MPRRGSKAQLVHLLAEVRAHAIREIYGDMGIYPQDLYDHFSCFSLEELQEMAAGITPTKVGRPKTWSRYDALAAQVDLVLKSGLRKTERGACAYVASKAGIPVSEAMLRKHYRRKRPN